MCVREWKDNEVERHGPKRRPHATYQCPTCGAPLSLWAATAAGPDETDELPPVREFRRCLECLHLAVRIQGMDEWQDTSEEAAPARIRAMIARL
ncbi:hypothetical protein GCM10028790_43040 [Micromonospora taraxaci]